MTAPDLFTRTDYFIIGLCCLGIILLVGRLLPCHQCQRPAGVEPDEPWPRVSKSPEVRRRRPF